jgi:hypothetical protein
VLVYLFLFFRRNKERIWNFSGGLFVLWGHPVLDRPVLVKGCMVERELVPVWAIEQMKTRKIAFF